MKKVNLVILAVIVISLLIALALWFYWSFKISRPTPAIVTESAEAIEKAKPYSMEQISPEWIMIRAKNNRWGRYSEALAKGLKALDRNYIIIDVKPIQEHHYREGSHANFSAPVQAFLVKVEPRYQ